MGTYILKKQLTTRTLTALSLACAFGIFAFVGTIGLRGSRLTAVIVAVGVAASIAWFFWRRTILPYDQDAVSRPLKVISGLATIGALLQLTFISVFMINPAQVGYATGPLRGAGQLVIAHSCVSAYFVAAQAAPTVPNLYSDQLYSLPSERPDAPRRPRRIESFNVDAYEYPPPFLLLPRAMMVLSPDFLHFRMVWFALNGGLLLLGLLAIARVIGPVAGTRALLLSPLVFASDVTINTLQIGNLEAMIFALALLGMAYFAKGRCPAGGLMLAFATMSKLFPGLLIAYLVVRRQWRALAWTVGFSAALILVSVLDTGWAPYHAFIHQLPKLLGGEAFPAFRNPVSVAKNYSVPGMVFKLPLFGLPGGSFAAMRIVGWIYTLIALAATVVLARRTSNRHKQPMIWLAILMLASLRSPFLPPYVVLSALWLLTLLAATVAPTFKRLCGVLLAWVMLNIFIPQLHPDPRVIAIVALLPQAAMVILVLLAFRNSSKALGAEAIVRGERSLRTIPDENTA